MKSMKRKLRILQVTSAVEGGGGEQISLRLHRAFRRLGHRSMLFAGRLKNFSEEDVFQIPDRWDISARARNVRAVFRRVLALTGGRGATRLFPFFEALAFPRVAWDLWRGHEDYTQPGSHQLLTLAPEPPDVVLLHNLHARWSRREGFFDLEFLPELSRRAPVILFPQDPWLITGHCGHPITLPALADRLREMPRPENLSIHPAGCHRLEFPAQAEDLQPQPAVPRRAVAVAADDVRGGGDSPGGKASDPQQHRHRAVQTRRPPRRARRAGARSETADRPDLGQSPEGQSVEGIRLDPGNGRAFEPDEENSPPVDFLCVGDEGAPVEFGGVRIVFAGFVKDSSQMPAWYRAADIYFHPSRADTAPYSVLEAMATGLPVVATSVGGIPEQVEDGRTGYLVAPGDSEAMAARLAALLTKPEKAAAMGRRARARAATLFDFRKLTTNSSSGCRNCPQNNYFCALCALCG